MLSSSALQLLLATLFAALIAPADSAGLKPVSGLVVPAFRADTVYLVQFPRMRTIVSQSPFALKLETWLRLNNVPHRNVSNDLVLASEKGQIPFVELNGRQLTDSNFIIERLREHFNVPIDRNLGPLERAQSRALTVLIEESLYRCMMYDRSQNPGWMASERGFGAYLGDRLTRKFFNRVVVSQLQKTMKAGLRGQGYGRHSQAEVLDILRADLSAISTFLGNKQFMFGESPSTLDATLFGHLVQFTDCPLNSAEIMPFFLDSVPNLLRFVERMKARFWPDWGEIVRTQKMNSEDQGPSRQLCVKDFL